MKNPRARRNNVVCEDLAAETILYDRANNRAHSLNRTVGLVWQAADGQRSVEEIAVILHRELGIPADPGVVLLALQDLEGAGLIEEPLPVEARPELLSRREVARKLALAGFSMAMLPVVASIVAPTPAMAASMITAQQAGQDLGTVGTEAYNNPNFLTDPNAITGLSNAQNAYVSGNYNTEIQDLDGVINALGLPPL